MGSLRVAATLVHALGGLRVEVRLAGAALLEVRERPVGEPAPPGGPRVRTPCEFRCAVGRAHQQRLGGARLSFLGLPPGVDPVADVGVPPCGSHRAGDMYRVPLAGRWRWGVATTLDGIEAHHHAQEVADGWPALAPGDEVRIHHDPLTDVTVALVDTSAIPGSACEDAVVEMLTQLLARWSVQELLGSLAPVHDGVRED